ncbi:hypothetical protein QOZ80_3BG0271970 [Eleusine coracana subsp. coracana]|nr:hypothetical protein QOZ80_3BG0271970 [Eleusine coracana subsp. coracana]
MKEKLNNCSIDTLFDLCDLLAIPIVSKANSRKGDIVGKLLDFIAKPHAMDGTALYDEQESNCRKRKRGGESGTKDLEGARERSVKVAQRFHDEQTTSKRHHKYSESESADEGHEEDESMNSDNKETESYDEEAKDEDENDYSSRNGNTRSKCLKKVSSSSKSSKYKQSSDEDAKVLSEKSKSIVQKHSTKIETEIKEKKLSGKMVKKNKEKSADARKSFPRKYDLQKTIVQMLKKFDFKTTTFGDILKKLDDHYKMDLSSKKDEIKFMIEEEIAKLTLEKQLRTNVQMKKQQKHR